MVAGDGGEEELQVFIDADEQFFHRPQMTSSIP